MRTIVSVVQLNLVVLLFFGFNGKLFSQSFTEDLAMSSSQKNVSLFVKSIKETQSQQNRIENEVSIVQIGNLNTANVVKSNPASFSAVILQEGQNNSIFSYKVAKNVKVQMEQNGNNNMIFDYGNNRGIDANQQFIQKGNNLNIISTGLNSISKDMTIQQTGTARTISVINL
ncbi:hypothetical protein [Flavobacterium sp. TSSA_36]|uniref:hypothetical protein n=1 Tax=Flavobacterium sp. TSSA_36 TaxID=3447669 RepID=UPI003F34ACA2